MTLFLRRLMVYLCLVGASACVSEQFHRVETLPEGMQVDALASGLSNRTHTSHISDRYAAPYAEVWESTLRVANRVKQQGVKPVLLADRTRGEIKLRESHVLPSADEGYDPDELRLRGWIDEFRFQVTALSDTRTKVMVARTVRGIPAFRVCGFVLSACQGGLEPEVSNGHIEDWILTQIEDDLARRRHD